MSCKSSSRSSVSKSYSKILINMPQLKKVHNMKSSFSTPNLKADMPSLSKIVMGYNDGLECINKKAYKYSEK